MRGRLQVLVIVLTGVFLAGMILIFAVFTMSPDIAALNRPILLTAFIAALFLSLVCPAWLWRRALRPYPQLMVRPNALLLSIPVPPKTKPNLFLRLSRACWPNCR